MQETAYAKINLALHVRRRREDGYHEIETLFAFVSDGDRLEAHPAKQDTLHVYGEFAQGLSNPFDNLVSRALALLPRPEGLAIRLEKRLPIAAGLGGGSADAGAVFRLVAEQYGYRDDLLERAAKLGADVPACVRSRAAVGRGTGTELSRAINDLEGWPVLLVNPRVPLPTGPVFAGWDGQDRGALPKSELVSRLALEGRNDLETPAIGLCPVIADVLAELRRDDPWLARMSGSGATCFGIYFDPDARDAAAARIAADHPDWWQMASKLR